MQGVHDGVVPGVDDGGHLAAPTNRDEAAQHLGRADTPAMAVITVRDATGGRNGPVH